MVMQSDLELLQQHLATTSTSCGQGARHARKTNDKAALPHMVMQRRPKGNRPVRSARQWQAKAPQRQIDDTTEEDMGLSGGLKYSFQEMADEFGEIQAQGWLDSSRAQTQELRVALDGHVYTRDDFVSWYGRWGNRAWELGTPLGQPTCAGAKDDTNCLTFRDLEVELLTGECISLQGLSSNLQIIDVLQLLKTQLSISPAMVLRLMSDGQVLQESASISAIGGDTVSALVVAADLSQACLRHLAGLKVSVDRETQQIGLLEARCSFSPSLVAEIIAKANVQRFIFSTEDCSRKRNSISELATSIQHFGQLDSLEYLKISHVHPCHLDDIGSVLQCCPNLRACALHGHVAGALNKDNMSALRSQFSSVSIQI